MAARNVFDPYGEHLMAEALANLEHEDLGDDFADDIRQMNRLATAPDGGGNSDFAMLARKQQADEQQQAREAPFVRTAPRSASKCTLGQTVTLLPGGPALPLLNWVGDAVESTPVTITVLPVLDQTGNFPGTAVSDSILRNSSASLNRAFAYIKWGTRGSPAVAEVDIGKGRQFNVSGSFVEVGLSLPYDSTEPAATQQVTGWLAFGSTDRTTNATRTIYVGALASVTTTQILVPNFATSVWIQRALALDGATPVAAPIYVAFQDIRGNVLYQIYGNDTLYSVTSAPIPLSDDVFSININNASAYEIPSMRLIFNLDF